MNLLLSIISQRRRAGFDPDAADYFSRIVTAGSTISEGNKTAVNAFIVGCKADGIWGAIKASCILAASDTLAGGLVPLVGPAPTNVDGLFVSGDYSRTTGLLGNGSTKYLNSNYNNNANPQNSKHLAVYLTENIATSVAFRCHLGIAPNTGQVGASIIGLDGSLNSGRYRANGQTASVISNGLTAGFRGVNRSSASEIVARQNSTTATTAAASETPININITVFARNVLSSTVDSHSNARLSFYSIGESLDLALLSARLATLMSAIS